MNTNSALSVVQIQNNAATIGAKLANDKEFLKQLTLWLNAREIDKRAIGNAMMRLFGYVDKQRDINIAGLYTSEERAQMPQPYTYAGFDKKDKSGRWIKVGGNQVPELYKDEDGEHSWFADVYLMTPDGQHIDKELKAIQKAIDKDKSAEEPWSEMGVARLNNERATRTSRRDRGRNIIRDAKLAADKLEHLNRRCPALYAYLVMDQDPKSGAWSMAKVNQQFVVVLRADITKYKSFTLGSFIGIDVEAIVDGGGTWKAFNEALTRDNDGGDKKEGSPVNNFKGFEATLYNMVRYLGDVYGNEDNLKRFNRNMTTRLAETDSAEFVEAFGDLVVAMEQPFSLVEARYNEMKRAKARAQGTATDKDRQQQQQPQPAKTGTDNA